ncbi:hypothetical protein [Hydrogenimonas sp.]
MSLKEVLDPLRQRGLVFRRFEPFSLKEIGSRKRIAVFHGVDTENRYTLVFAVKRRSRVLRRDVAEWLELKKRIEAYLGYPILQTIALIEAPLCSHAKGMLEEAGWTVLAA